MGPLCRIGGLYYAVVTMLVESCDLYVVNSVLYIGLWGAGSHGADTFPIPSETQVCDLSLLHLYQASQCQGAAA